MELPFLLKMEGTMQRLGFSYAWVFFVLHMTIAVIVVELLLLPMVLNTEHFGGRLWPREIVGLWDHAGLPRPRSFSEPHLHRYPSVHGA